MRLISLGILFENDLQSQKVLDIIQEFFNYSLMTNYDSIELDVQSSRVFFGRNL